ncbi:MAG: DNA primase [Deltaproteobacteria bacterium]|nr:DNA primase [Deltaproteobacteria bacterium]
MKYPSQVIDDVCHQVDFVSLVSSYLDLHQSGKDWKGLCPFHDEKTPSFHVDPVKNLFYCFGCGKGGGPITFLMEMTGQPFVDCLKELAERANYALPVLGPDQNDASGPSKPSLYEAMKVSQQFYGATLSSVEGKAARAYLAGRGISQGAIESFGLGLAPDGWDRLGAFLRSKKVPQQVALEAGLIKRSRDGNKVFDTFRNRITFPLLDSFPRVVAFAARTYAGEDGAKYINSPTTPIYEKGRSLYGFNLARDHIKGGGLAFIVEGYFDVISMHSGGAKATVAAMGTSLTQYQVNALKGLAKEVLLVFDGDKAGLAAAKRALPLLYNADLDGRVICLPAGHDPDTFVREFGAKAFYELADKAQDLSGFYIGQLLNTEAKTITGQGRMITDIQEILRQVPDKAKGQYLRNKLADLLGLSADLFELRKKEETKSGAFVTKALPSTDYNLVAGNLISFVIVHRECLSLLDRGLLDIWPRDRTLRVLTEFLGQVGDSNDSPGIRPENLRLEDDPLMSSLVSGAMMGRREYPVGESQRVAKLMIDKLARQAAKALNEEYTRAIKMAEERGDAETVEKLLSAKHAGA